MTGAFDGVKILELGSGAAGPVATRYFADHGARVVKIESAARPDFLRLVHQKPGDPHGLEGAPIFVLLNANKRDVALNLGKPEGVALAWRLVHWADVVVENFAPRAMAKWGLDGASLLVRKPGLVMVSSCLYGQTGPQRDYPGFGAQGSALSGFNHLTGWPDRDGVGPYGTLTDSLSPRFVALLVAAALRHRERTGEGQVIDVSQIETAVYALAEMVVRHSASGEVMGRAGNRSEQGAPHGVYPCAGDDRWLALAVFSDLEWRLLRRQMGNPPFAQDPRFARAAGRLAHADELDAELARWTARHDADALAAKLQAAGLAAGPVQGVAELARDPQLAHRGHFVELTHPRLGRVRCEHAGFRLSESEAALRTPGPLLGEHTREVLGSWLGVPEDELARLEAAGVLR
jgi:benzylsuccinate CoA-transferase BbsF subunit